MHFWDRVATGVGVGFGGRRDSRMRRGAVPHLHGAHRSNMKNPVFLRRRLYRPNLILNTTVTCITSLLFPTLQKSASRQAYSRSAGQEIHRTVRDPKVHYRVHSGLLLSPIMDQFNPIHAAFSTWFTMQSKVAQVTQ